MQTLVCDKLYIDEDTAYADEKLLLKKINYLLREMNPGLERVVIYVSLEEIHQEDGTNE